MVSDIVNSDTLGVTVNVVSVTNTALLNYSLPYGQSDYTRPNDQLNGRPETLPKTCASNSNQNID
jgi:hypothetical protein